MNQSPSPVRWTTIDTVSYLIIGSVVGRMLPYYWPTPYRWVMLGLWGLYVLLFTLERFVSGRFPHFLPPYFVVQLLISMVLCLVIPSFGGPQDYFAMLVLPLCIQAMWRLPAHRGPAWVGAFAMVMAGSMILYYLKYENSLEGVGYALAYVAGCLMISVFSSVTLRAEEARRQTQALNAELQAANQKLQVYARQVEQMAAAEERARLARDLHDSVSQTIFSLTLTAQATRILLDRDPARVAGQLDHLQELARNALAEMRSLIQHLRPDALQQEGLSACLQRHIAARKMQDGLTVELVLSGERRLPAALEESLFRLVQEALNNVVKHARVDTARVTLDLEQNPILLCIEDQGVGFDQSAAPSSGHLGLAGMEERVRALGGRLEIETAPGKGTRVWVRDLRVQEGEYAGRTG